MNVVLQLDELPGSKTSRDFEGQFFGDVESSIFVIDYPEAGMGPKLHSHPYSEVFVVQSGEALFTVDSRELTATAGQIAVVQPNTPHKFVSTGELPLRMVTVQASGVRQTTWLE